MARMTQSRASPAEACRRPSISRSVLRPRKAGGSGGSSGPLRLYVSGAVVAPDPDEVERRPIRELNSDRVRVILIASLVCGAPYGLANGAIERSIGSARIRHRLTPFSSQVRMRPRVPGSLSALQSTPMAIGSRLRGGAPPAPARERHGHHAAAGAVGGLPSRREVHRAGPRQAASGRSQDTPPTPPRTPVGAGGFRRSSTSRFHARTSARASGVEGSFSAVQPQLSHAASSRSAWRSLRIGPVQPRRPVSISPALQTLPELAAHGAGLFGLIFIDADKKSNAEYLQWSLRLAREGTLIVADNVTRASAILDRKAEDPRLGDRSQRHWRPRSSISSCGSSRASH